MARAVKRYQEIVELRRQLFALKRQLKRIIRKIEDPSWHREAIRKSESK